MVLILSTEFFTKFGLGWSGTSHEKFTKFGNFLVLVAEKGGERKEKKGRKKRRRKGRRKEKRGKERKKEDKRKRKKTAKRLNFCLAY